MTDYPVIVIRNLDRNNKKFRPSDWVDRLAGAAARYERGAVRYDARVMPCCRCEQTRCLTVDRHIADDQPHVLETVLSFMEINQLDDSVESCPVHAQHYADFVDGMQPHTHVSQ